jgi:aquaporin Z
MLLKLLTELIGTFVFLGVILSTGEAIPIGIALAAVILFGGKVSGGHFNPAVTVMMLANGGIEMTEAVGYVASQVVGGLAALRFSQMVAASA